MNKRPGDEPLHDANDAKERKIAADGESDSEEKGAANSRRTSTDIETGSIPVEASAEYDFISAMLETGMSHSQVAFAHKWYKAAKIDDPLVIVWADHTTFAGYASPKGDHLGDLRAIFGGLPNLDVESSDVADDAWAFREASHMTDALASIKNNHANAWCLHLSPRTEACMVALLGPTAAGLMLPGRRSPIAKVLQIFKTDRQIPGTSFAPGVFEM
ncbi:hypothetical protein B484DRAFT_437642 [Ochromonadaceae sp. CCMP2298]|nr:hypothetical protein B484DRAFT_437642 [Ochromonadaceae sp. CCMP2298]